jgi:uncharacterized membrane protein YsdA (DUF1294 family)
MFLSPAFVYASVVILLSLITFTAYGVDKHRAQSGGRRISEATLHWLALLGGWPGAWAGQRVFRHKTQKLSFRLIYWAIVALHVGLIIAIVLLWRQ